MTNFRLLPGKSLLSATLGLTMALLLCLPFGSALAQTPKNGASGLPLPRFVSLRSDDIRMRFGPGRRYDVAWVFKQAGLPVEIIQESENWRKVRDSAGVEGWIHKNLISGRRTALVTPWDLGETTQIYRQPDTTSSVKAILKGFVMVELDKCQDSWCQISGSYVADKDGTVQKQSFKGWIAQDSLWGVYPDEMVE